MEYASFLKKITNHYQSGLPFVAYILPESTEIKGIFQKEDTLYTTADFSEKGFVMAAFNAEKEAYCIPEAASIMEEAIFSEAKISAIHVSLPVSAQHKKKYLELLSKALVHIKSKQTAKIVLSRTKEVPIPHFNIELLVKRLVGLYPSAFRYIWYHPTTGIWCGATPEILLKTKDTSFSTMALAGTQKHHPKRTPNWTAKEIEEQQLVTDSIVTNLQKITSVVKVSKTYSHRAGTLEHLRTDISGMLKNSKTTVAGVAFALHPTPAVCGTPQKNAKKFIMGHEGYDREFYTGFLGPVSGEHNQCDLFVNLRCMKIKDQTATLYVGGGVTASSQIEDEWEETKNKLQTMVQVLQPML